MKFLLIIAFLMFGGLANATESTPLGLKGDDGVIRQVPGNCGPNAHTENHPKYGPVCVQNEGSWKVAQSGEHIGEPCTAKNSGYDKSNGFVLICRGKWQKASTDELKKMADSNNYRKLTPAESKAAAFAEARPITLADGALAKSNGCLYVIRKANTEKGWLLTQVTCDQSK